MVRDYADAKTTDVPGGRTPQIGDLTPEQQRCIALVVAYAALKLGAGESFRRSVCGGAGLFGAVVAQNCFCIDLNGALQIGACLACAVGVAVAVAPGFADLLVLAAFAGYATKPLASSFDARAIKDVRRTARAADAAAAKKSKNPFKKLKEKALGKIDDFLSGLADRAADVRFFDLTICLLAKVTPPGDGVEPVYVVGAFRGWYNVNALAIHVDRWCADFANAHARATEEGNRMMLVRVPPGARPGDRLQVTTPLGKAVEFVVPRGAAPGTVIQLAY